MSVHDLTFVHFPELCTADTLAYPPLIRRALARGASIHTGSQFVADEICEAFGVTPDRVAVVPYGATALPPAREGTDAATGRRLAGGGPFVLALGTVEPRKDLPSLVRAFDGLADAHPDVGAGAGRSRRLGSRGAGRRPSPPARTGRASGVWAG